MRNSAAEFGKMCREKTGPGYGIATKYVHHRPYCCALLIFNFQFQVKVHIYTQLSEHIMMFGQKCVFAVVLWCNVDELWASGVNNLKMVRHWTKITKERHILDMSSTRQNESQCLKMCCNPLTRMACKIYQKVLFLWKATCSLKKIATTVFMLTSIHIFLPTFVEIHEVEVIKTMRGR